MTVSYFSFVVFCEQGTPEVLAAHIVSTGLVGPFELSQLLWLYWSMAESLPPCGIGSDLHSATAIFIDLMARSHHVEWRSATSGAQRLRHLVINRSCLLWKKHSGSKGPCTNAIFLFGSGSKPRSPGNP